MRMIDPNAFRADRTDHLVLEMSALYLDHNKLTSLPPNMLDLVDDIINKVDFSHNMISQISGKVFFQPSIQIKNMIADIDLSFNLLKSVPTQMMVNAVRNLQTLNLEGNQISLIRNNAFARARVAYEWSYLENLNVAGNFITKIEPKAFHGRAAALLNLNLTRNLLTSLHGVQNLHLLRHLDISYNRMQEIQLPSDIGLHKLRTLNLKGNVIKVVRNGDLAHINHLYQVDLSDNVIDTIEPSAFYHMPSLSNLDLSNNRITSLPGEIFLSVGFTSINVTQINLKGNQFVRSAFCNLTVLFESLSLTTKTSRAQLVPTFLSQIEPADMQLRLTEYANDTLCNHGPSTSGGMEQQILTCESNGDQVCMYENNSNMTVACGVGCITYPICKYNRASSQYSCICGKPLGGVTINVTMQCDPIMCKVPNIVHGSSTKTFTKYGEVLNYSCNDGLVKSAIPICEANGNLSATPTCEKTGLGLVGHRYCTGDVILKRTLHLFTFLQAKVLCGSVNGKVLGPMAYSNNCTIGLLTSKMVPAWINVRERENLQNAYVTGGSTRVQYAKQPVVCELPCVRSHGDHIASISPAGMVTCDIGYEYLD
eukprot:scpid66246/ scgid25429/ Leucine-rich repeats and immunoglobulin-like domains protein 3